VVWAPAFAKHAKKRSKKPVDLQFIDNLCANRTLPPPQGKYGIFEELECNQRWAWQKGTFSFLEKKFGEKIGVRKLKADTLCYKGAT